MIKYQSYDKMNSPLPIAIGTLSASQRGAKQPSPSIRSREGEKGGEYIQSKSKAIIIHS
jgi:hypothetical protein